MRKIARVHVASWNTRSSTELTIRTARRYAGHPFELVVGDGGSSDGSLEMLLELERRRVLRLERASGGRTHAEWLDRWIATCDADYAVFVDSDVEFLRPGWLSELLGAAADQRADLVYAETLAGSQSFTVPRSGELVELASRPAPWLFLADVRRARAVGVSFAEIARDREEGGRRRVYDVGGWFFSEARRSGLTYHVMDPRYRDRYRHFAGASWQLHDRSGSFLRLSTHEWIELRLQAARARDAGEPWRERRLTARAAVRRRLSRASELAVKAATPDAWTARLERGRRRIPWQDPGST